MFPWRLFITAVLAGFILRPLFPDNKDYLVASFVFGVALVPINHIFKLGLDK